MVKLYLMGGFGNLLFQKLFAMELEKHFDLEIDESLISQNCITKYVLGWKIHHNYSGILFDKTTNTYDVNIWWAFVDMILLLLSRKSGRMLLGRLWVTNKVPIGPGCKVMAGYCQDKSLFENCRENLPDLSILIRGKFPHKKHGPVIHYRGTDSVWAKDNDGFYDIAMSQQNSNEKITVVTDDIERARQTFGEEAYLVSGTLLSDFSLMINSHYLVVAPSTLSWWAGLLSFHAEVIIMPSILRDKLPNLSYDIRVRYV